MNNKLRDTMDFLIGLGIFVAGVWILVKLLNWIIGI
jgi:hypothetical protein